MAKVWLGVIGLVILGGAFWGLRHELSAPASTDQNNQAQKISSLQPTLNSNTQTKTTETSSSHRATGGAPLSQSELLALADNKYSNGAIPLGDYKYITSGPKKGYIYLCRAMGGGGGAQANGPWIHGSTWNPSEKIAVRGAIVWPNATFSNIISGASRILSGNGLPVGYTTGVFPISASDPAYAYDRNPNSISAQSLLKTLPENPAYSDSPYCMGGEVGIMLSGCRFSMDLMRTRGMPSRMRCKILVAAIRRGPDSTTTTGSRLVLRTRMFRPCSAMHSTAFR